ncbi:hypothetical protein FACS1894190_16930 [Spirochaetia bacterium]|nr:hypothetical protein FACS1894190_16930 [Spirochaetia bacterium]
MKVVIMAGGRGTRVATLNPELPKPMLNVCGKTILEYQIDCLKKNGLTDILMIVGHKAPAIKDFFKDGSAFGCRITYYTEEIALGSGGALFKIQDQLPEDFILLNGDIIFDVDFSRIIDFHKSKNALATLAAHPNSHPYDSALLITDDEKRVIKWMNKEDKRYYAKNQVNSGIHILTKELLRITHPVEEKVDLDRFVLKPNLETGRIYAYNTPEYIKDMGTPERYAQVSADIEKGLVTRKNLLVKQRAIFLDRDGTINQANGFVCTAKDFVLIEGAASAIKKINQAGFLAIVITNQPVIARGECTFAELENIHNKMESTLGREGAYLDDIFFCPHHPQKGFAGEVPELKIDCTCRKPSPGMILQAAEKYNIDLTKSYMAGDSLRDIQAGIAAGCKSVFLESGVGTPKDLPAGTPVFPNLKDFINAIIV